MGRVLFLLPTGGFKTKALLAAARELGVEAVAASEEPSALEGFSKGNLISFDFSDPAAAADAAEKCGPFDAVIGIDESTSLPATRISQSLGLRANDPRSISISQDKTLQRTALAAAGLSVPRFAPATENSSPVGYPCVLKPTGLSASRGVIRADNDEQYRSALTRIRSLLAELQSPCSVLVESFAAGPEISLEGLLENGRLRVLAVFEKPESKEGPFFPETIFVTPPRLADGSLAAAERAVQDAARALGLREGPVHAELRLGHLGPLLLEIHPRTIGGECAKALSFGMGLSLENIVLRSALGLGSSFWEREKASSGVLMLLADREGTLAGIEGIREAESVAGIVQASFPNLNGRFVRPLPEGGEYLGFLFSKGESPAEVEASLRTARSLISPVFY